MEDVYIYSTASTVAAFVNGFHIEQAYAFNYKESVPKVPVFGYNDYEYSKVLRGKGIVQGILVLNFVFPGYLSAALSYMRNPYVAKLHNYDLPGGDGKYLPSTAKQVQENIFKNLKTELPANDTPESKAARAAYIANLITAKNADVDATKKALNRFFGIGSDPKTDSAFYDQPATPRSRADLRPSPLIVDSNAAIGNYIDIYYQDPDLCTWFIRFNNVHFTEVSQNISQAGAEGSSEPLYEIYEFIAKNKQIIEIR